MMGILANSLHDESFCGLDASLRGDPNFVEKVIDDLDYWIFKNKNSSYFVFL